MSLKRFAGYEFEISDKYCKVYFPGIGYDDFDRNGCLSAWKISKYFEGGRSVSFSNGFLGAIMNRKYIQKFVIAQNFKLKSNYFKRYCSFPVSVRLELIDIGSSSVTLRQLLTNEKDKEIVAVCDFKVVVVDIETKRPVSTPQEAKDKYLTLLSNELSNTTKPTFLQNIPDLPLDAYHIPIFVLPNDTDSNQHLNQGQFIRYSLDCAAMAAVEGYYKYFITDICNYQPTDIQVLYKREAVAGDLVHAHTWQESNNPQQLHFIITKDKNSLFYSKMCFALDPIPKL